MSRTRLINIGVVSVLATVAVWVTWSLIGDDEGYTDGSVISLGDQDDHDTAEVAGTLRMENGCLLVDDDVVFFTVDSSWDQEEDSVAFDDAPDVEVGGHFQGGGGYYQRGDLARLVEDEVVREAVLKCLAATGSQTAVAAHPA